VLARKPASSSSAMVRLVRLANDRFSLDPPTDSMRRLDLVGGMGSGVGHGGVAGLSGLSTDLLLAPMSAGRQVTVAAAGPRSAS